MSILSSILIDERIDKLVIYFHTNEQDGEQNNYMVNFSNKSDLRWSFRRVYVTFRIETFQKDQQKAIDMFFEGNDVSVSLPTGYGKSIIYQAAPVIDRLSLLEETGHYIYCAAR